jgi:hypothetical protein
MQVVVDPFLWQELLQEAQLISQEPHEAARIARYFLYKICLDIFYFIANQYLVL